MRPQATALHILTSEGKNFGDHQLLLFSPKPDKDLLKSMKKVLKQYLPMWMSEIGSWAIDYSEEAEQVLRSFVLRNWSDVLCTKCDFSEDCSEIKGLQTAMRDNNQGVIISNLTPDLRFSVKP